MFNEFRDCVILYLDDCTALVSNQLYFTVERTLKEAFDGCNDDVNVDMQQIL